MTNPMLRRLGHSGLAVSATGLGCNNLGRTGTVTADLAACRTLVDTALDAGITLFDVADIYGAEPGVSETILGIALGARRDEVVLATKFGMDAKGANGRDDGARGSRRYIVQSVEASLRRLKTDWIDLYQLHQPDPATPLAETLSALDDLVDAGKVRYIGHSNFAAWQLADAAWLSRESGAVPFISAQNEYSLVRREIEAELIPAATHFGVGILPFFPLANGLLTGKFRRGKDAPAGTRLADLKPALLESAPWEAVELLARFAADRDLGMVDVAFGWLLAQPQVASVIAGATTPAQVVANAAASGRWVPGQDELDAIDLIFAPPVGLGYR
ncbi:aldo/keto reductase [Nakamurella sp. PAMC28650]|jgi:aryl-alcohol dehydrogenase-like predicted oxidoreductase|uniref:aldo/keto reductase n=1 Tax=Nakamurella sp. PAMC28650 TaxID=2762325 RepID=UPI00164D81EB|nr:aldo/keto reductase [Nakamurella sp. PAMC28650]QNK81717.1 aldo/keto reductase [Nakamurella sp. PAMC28650]